MAQEYSIQQVAKLAGTTSRALRHYGDEGLLEASRVGHNGYRYYDARALVRLQRILMLRDLGLSLPHIREVLAQPITEPDALRRHRAWLGEEQERIQRQIIAVETTIATLDKGGPLMAENMFDGFDHTRYTEEVQQRWGSEAYEKADTWWRGQSDVDRAAWQERVSRLNDGWKRAAARGEGPQSAEAQALAADHVAWLRSVPGTPAGEGGDVRGYVLGLAELYVTDERFAANYGGAAGAEFVRAALRAHMDTII